MTERQHNPEPEPTITLKLLVVAILGIDIKPGEHLEPGDDQDNKFMVHDDLEDK